MDKQDHIELDDNGYLPDLSLGDGADTDDNASVDEHPQTIRKKDTPESSMKSPVVKRVSSRDEIQDVDDAVGSSVHPRRTSVRGSSSSLIGGTEVKRRRQVGLRLPETPEEQFEADFPSSSRGSLVPGARVLARWHDKNFYPANVVFHYGFGRYKVQFTDDRSIRIMTLPEIVTLTELKPESILMMAADMDDGGYELLEPVIVKSVPECESQAWFEGLFEVDNTVTEKIETVCWLKFVIDKDQTSNYMKSIVNSAAEGIAASNISDVSERKERRIRSTLPKPAEVVPEGTSSTSILSTPTPKSAFRKRTPTSAAPDGGKSAAMPPTLKPVYSEEPSVEEASAPVTSSSKKYKPMTIDAPPLSDEEPSEGGSDTNQIFADLYFVLTLPGLRQPSIHEILFDKKKIRRFIEERGGCVLDSINNFQDRSVCFLISNSHYRTYKYLCALAHAIPCVSHLWIQHSCDQNDLLDVKNYLLPAGVGLEKGQLIEWHERCPSLLNKQHIFVHTENRLQDTAALEFEQIWSPLVECMNARLLKSIPYRNSFDYLVTDASCSQKVIEKAKSKGAAVVSCEWLIQAIVTGKLPSPDGHHKYAYNYIDMV